MSAASLVAFLPAQYQALATSILMVCGAVYALLMVLDKMFQAAKALLPNNKTIAKIENALSFLASRWPQALETPETSADAPVPIEDPIHLIAHSNAIQGPPKGFISIRLAFLIVALGAVYGSVFGCATASSVTWGNPTFGTGPSVGLFEVTPANTHPVQIAPGAGWQASLEEGHVTIAGAQYSLLDVSALALGSVVSPAGGGPAGQLQVGGLVSTLNESLGIAPLCTPYTASNGGFLQGGRPGFTLGLVISPVTLGQVLLETGLLSGSKPHRGTIVDLVK